MWLVGYFLLLAFMLAVYIRWSVRSLSPSTPPPKSLARTLDGSLLLIAFIGAALFILGLLAGVGYLAVSCVLFALVAMWQTVLLWRPARPPVAGEAPLPELARQQVAAVAALRRAGMDEEWIRTFVTFEDPPPPQSSSDNRALLGAIKESWGASALDRERGTAE